MLGCLDMATSGCRLSPFWGCQCERCYLTLVCSPYIVFYPSSSCQLNRTVIRFTPCIFPSVLPTLSPAHWVLHLPEVTSAAPSGLQLSVLYSPAMDLQVKQEGFLNQLLYSNISFPPSINIGHTDVCIMEDSIYQISTSF